MDASKNKIRNSIRGHLRILKDLDFARRAGHLPSTLAFCGPEGIGRSLVARALAQDLVCEDRSSIAEANGPVGEASGPVVEACGLCGPCLRMAKGQSEGLLLVGPQKNAVNLADLAPVADFVQLARLGRARVIIIDHAEMLNPMAANTLLKVLEEPPDATYFVLLAPSSCHLLNTLRSRSQIVNFAPLSLADLQSLYPTAPAWMLKNSLGQAGRVARLLSDNAPARRQARVSLLQNWLAGAEFGYLNPEWKDLLKDREEAKEFSQLVVGLCRDAVALQVGPRPDLRNPDLQQQIQDMAKLPREQLFKWAEHALKWERELGRPFDAQLLAEEFWLVSHERGF